MGSNGRKHEHLPHGPIIDSETIFGARARGSLPLGTGGRSTNRDANARAIIAFNIWTNGRFRHRQGEEIKSLKWAPVSVGVSLYSTAYGRLVK